MDELIAEFISETYEGLETLDNQLVELEQNPENEELVSSVFRVMHTIKGTCGFLGLNKLAAVAHAGENVVDKIRNKQVVVNKNYINIILLSVDSIKEIIAHVRDNGNEPDKDYSAIIAEINKSVSVIEGTKTKEKDNPQESIKTHPTEHSEDKHSSSHNNAKLLKVNVDVLENLMQIVSELVLNRNQLIQLDRTLHDSRFSSPIQRLNVITSSLQETVMETRMQPVGSAWVKMPRMVRDLSYDLKKKIKLVMIGEDTELDRQLIESIKDPLVHMVRNSADHGLETTSERIASGKPEEGIITLNAYHQGGHIIIEISDDGRGLNLSKIKKKILQNKLATEKLLAEMSDTQILQYIFKPGFSTAEVVTDVSGRGVGMDVVKTNIENIRGTVDLHSVEGKGTTFVIKIPLTLAIMPILVVECEKKKFGIPQINIIEMVRASANSGYIIEEINEHKVLRLRDSLLPLVTLSEILEIENYKEDLENKLAFVVVCEVNGHNFGIIVDRIYDTEEIVLKPVSKLIKSISAYSGNTLLGNGEVIMILDPAGIIKSLNSFHAHDHESLSLIAENGKSSLNKLSNFLVLKSGTALKAVPLELVSRLEEIDVSKIESSNDRPVIQYRGSLMFLSMLDKKYELPKEGLQEIVVFSNNEHVLGLVVEKIVDIIEQDIESSLNFEDSDVNAVVLGGKTMDLVDINQHFEKMFKLHNNPLPKLSKKQKYTGLMVDDSMFFRKAIPPILTDYGINVETAQSGADALNLLRQSKFDFVIADINMPKMSGFELANICYNDEKLKLIPIIALTANIDAIKDADQSKHPNIKYYVPKTSHYELIDLVYSLLNIGV